MRAFVYRRPRTHRHWRAVGALCLLLMPAVATAQELPPPPPAAPAEQTPKPPRPPAPPGILAEPHWLTGGIDLVLDKFTASGAPRDGFYPAFGTRMPASGWIAVGPGYRKHLRNGAVFVDVSGAVSWRQFMSGDARVELPRLVDGHLTLGAQVLAQDWTQIMFFGEGPDSPRSQRSQFRLRAADTSVYATARPGDRVDVRARVGVLTRPELDAASGWNRRDFPNTVETFTDATAAGLGGTPRLWHADFAMTVDTLNHTGHPTRGDLIQAEASMFHDADTGAFSFRRMEVVALHVQPLIEDRWTVAARATLINSTPSSGGRVPFFLMPTLGGQSLLRGYDSDRFRDRNLIALNLESRWALFSHLDAALFTDIGEVAPQLSALNRRELQSAVGAGLRLHTGVSTLVRFDAARGSEGWRFAFKLSESLSLSTVRRWATVLPIVP